MIHSFYASNMPTNNNNEKRSRSSKEYMTHDVSYTLFRNLEREEKRIRTGLLKLGIFIETVDLYSAFTNYAISRITWCTPKWKYVIFN